MIRFAIGFVLLMGTSAQADCGTAEGVDLRLPFPMLVDITGVAATDTLNIRQAPDHTSPTIGSFAANAQRIEVITVSENSKWGAVNSGEGQGWIRLCYADLALPPSYEIPSRLACFGNKPFWSLKTQGGVARLNTMADDQQTSYRIHPFTTASNFLHTAATSSLGRDLFLSVTREECNDGMSDNLFGLSITLYRIQGETAGTTLGGCCSLF